MAYHQSFICSGIKHCEYAHPLIFHPCQAYDCVKPENINNLRKMVIHSHKNISIEEQIKKDTQRLVLLFLFYIMDGLLDV